MGKNEKNDVSSALLTCSNIKLFKSSCVFNLLQYFPPHLQKHSDIILSYGFLTTVNSFISSGYGYFGYNDNGICQYARL